MIDATTLTGTDQMKLLALGQSQQMQTDLEGDYAELSADESALWAPAAASGRAKMLYAASKSALTSELKGIAVIHSATEAAELELAAVASRIPGAAIGDRVADTDVDATVSDVDDHDV